MVVARSDHNLIRVAKAQYRNPIYLAMEWQRVLDSGQCESLSALARHFKVSRARVTQVMNLLSLSTDVIDIIRSLGDPINSPVVAERRLRPLLSLLFRLANRRSRLKRCCSRMLKNRHNRSSLVKWGRTDLSSSL